MMYKVYKLPDLHAQPEDGGAMDRNSHQKPPDLHAQPKDGGAMDRNNHQTAGMTCSVYKGPM